MASHRSLFSLIRPVRLAPCSTCAKCASWTDPLTRRTTDQDKTTAGLKRLRANPAAESIRDSVLADQKRARHEARAKIARKTKRPRAEKAGISPPFQGSPGGRPDWRQFRRVQPRERIPPGGDIHQPCMPRFDSRKIRERQAGELRERQDAADTEIGIG